MILHLLKRVFLRPSFYVQNFSIYLIALCISLPAQSSAQESDYISSLIASATQKKLSQKVTWHKLLHYKKNNKKVKSEIVSSDFFLDVNGNVDSQAELNTTIKYLFNKNNAQNYICKFPARYKWLKGELNINDNQNFNLENCPEYNEWSKNGDIKSISLVFASGHLSNPASFYGHILLKFNTDAEDDNNILDSSLNFGAITPDNENPILYIIKGLGGWI